MKKVNAPPINAQNLSILSASPNETLGGGFSPSAVNAIFRYKRMARAGFDNTKYRKSTKHISYLAHHTQSISTAITREDSRAMHEALSKKMAELSRHRPGGRA